jgi:parallel beta-helix repeat protein
MGKRKVSGSWVIILAMVVALLATVVPLSVSGQASSATIYVPDGYAKIQGAVNAASAGDTIIVRDSTYTENINVNKRLTIKSENGSDSTIVQAVSGGHIFEVTGNYVNIFGFTVTGATGSGKAGIYLNSADHCSIFENNASNNYHGIYLDHSHSNTIVNNSASINQEDGIHLSYSNGNSVTKNTVSDNNRHGIYLGASSNNSLLYNTAYNNDCGILLINCSNHMIGDNNVTNNRYGIYFGWSSNNLIANNDASTNKEAGICLSRSDNNTITNNNAANQRYGIFPYISSNNKIYLNNFINNGDNGYPENSTNVWNCPEPITYTYNVKTYTNYLGNYWDDYLGSDADEDGIGDTPYSIDSDADNYPLIEPWENYFAPLENQPPTASFTYSPENPIVNQIITFNASNSTDPDGTITNYEWEFGDGASGTGEVAFHSYSSVGDYIVTLTVTDDESATASDTETVIVGENALPTVETGDATDITETAATLNGVITDDGGASIGERRFDWGTTSSCSDGWTNSVTVSGNSFSYRLTGLEQGKTYYFRAWAHNSVGWGKGTVLPFTTTTPANVALTLYVHEGSASGPVLSGVRVTGQDGAGNSFDKTTGSSGYVTITEMPGSWQFTASKTGYQANSWAQSITTTCTRHAFLIKEDGDLGVRAANLAEQVVGAPYLWGGKGWNWNPAGGWKWENGKFVDPDSIRNGYYYYSSSTGQVEFGKGVDCSGLVFWAYNKAGVATKYKDPLNPIYEEGASGQWKNDVEQISNEIPAVGDLETGDLLFLDTNENGLADHVGMYVGDGYVIHSVGAEGVVKETLDDWLNRAVASTGKKYKDYFVGYGRVKTSSEVPKPVITSPLEITQKDTYYVGDTLTAKFTIANKGTVSITFDVLVVGGRDPNGEVVDFEKAYDITLNPGDSYNYQGSLTLPDKPGIYHFFCAYHTVDYLPGEDENNWNTNIDVEIEGKIVEDLSEAKRYRERNIIVFESATPVPPSALWEKVEGPWDSWPTSLGNWNEAPQVAVNPNNPAEIYVEAIHRTNNWWEGEGGKLYKSTDGGDSWNPINEGLPDLHWSEYYWPIRAIAIAPSDPEIIYVGTSDFNPYSSLIPSAKGIYKSTNGGSEWTSVGRPYTGWIFKTYFPISSIVVNPSDHNTVYVGTVGGGIWKTTNGGEPWEKIWGGPIIHKETLLVVNALSISPADPNIIYAAAYNFAPFADVSILIPNRLIKTEDGGNTWETLRVTSPLTKVDDIAVDNGNPDLVYIITDYFNAYKSVDGGKNWNDASGTEGANPLPSITPLGPSAGKISSISTHHDFSEAIYAAKEWEGRGVYYSPDSGANWFPYGLDKHVQELVFASNADSHVLFAAGIEENAAMLFKTDISNNPPNKPPIAKFIYSPPEPFVKLFVNQTITFDASSSYDLDGFITNYEWNFGDGNTTNTTEETITHLYSSAGNYTVNLTVTDDDGANNSASEIIEVRDAKPTVSIFTNKKEYHPWDIMMITIGLVNPTESTQQVLFKWDLILPDYDYWINITSTEITLSPMSVEYFLMPLHIVNWPSVEFNAIWHVAFYNTTTLEFISKDTADWKYVPSKMAEGETIPDVEEIASEITKEFVEIELPSRDV